MGYIDRDDYEELLDVLQELADEYGICIKGIIAESEDDMKDGSSIGFFFRSYYYEDEDISEDSTEEQEEPDYIREIEELWDLCYCHMEDEGIIF